MTIEIALLVAGGVLVATFIWRLHRLTRRIGDIQGEVNALRDMISRVFLIQLNHKTENDPSNLAAAPPPPSSDEGARNEMRKYGAPQLGLETAEIDELCAKLITLVPPKEAAPCCRQIELQQEHANRDLSRGTKLRKSGRSSY